MPSISNLLLHDMTTRKDDGRKLVQLTMRSELYERVRRYCDDREIPVSVWARDLIRQELDRLNVT
jgi:hypothetical protein